jgi:hypothetical protein
MIQRQKVPNLQLPNEPFQRTRATKAALAGSQAPTWEP